MQKNLVIVESPAKAKTLERFLGDDYKVLSSYGHIRDLKKKEFSINLDDFTPQYEIPEEKKHLVSELKSAAKKADTVWLASDEDREGEAISWHLAKVLGLDVEQTKRIVFHEITKPAILDAIKHPRHIDINLVNAQQARRVLDRIVGFKISPVLWRKVKPSLSAGRVQSVAVRLIAEREREIANFKIESAYRITALFTTPDGKAVLRAELNKRFATAEEAEAFLQACQDKRFTICDITKKPATRTPAPPFTTSTLQQEAARKLGFTVAQTMSVAQRLYEAGIITYMRTDSLNLSTLCLDASRAEIIRLLGDEYAQTRHYHTSSKGAQEAHEAIRPTDMSVHTIEASSQEQRLYSLIWKRTIASQMANAQLEKTTIRIEPDNNTTDATFTASAEVVLFDGFLNVYRESFDDDNNENEHNEAAPIDAHFAKGDTLLYDEIVATQRYTQHPPRYTEASLVHKLEDLGIGRPSTYAPTISTIQQRQYVQKGDTPGKERTYQIYTLKAGKDIQAAKKTEMADSEKNKLVPTDIGIVVNDYLVENFPEIVDYNFTAKVEKDFDEIAEGKEDWQKSMSDFYKTLEPMCEQALANKQEHKVGERILGTDPATGKEVSVKIGRFGPMVQIGQASDEEKPRFAQLKKGQSIQSISLEEALDLFKLPRTLGQFEDTDVTVGSGRFGPYVLHNKKYVSIPKDTDPLTITLDHAIELIEAKRKDEAEKHIKTFEEDPDIEVLKGRYGPYIAYKGSNYKLPKTVVPAQLTLEECLEIVKQQDTKPKTTRKGRTKKQ